MRLGGAGVRLGGAGVRLGGAGVRLGGAGVRLGGAGVRLGGAGVRLGGAGVRPGGAEMRPWRCGGEAWRSGVRLGGAGVRLGGAGVRLGGAEVLAALSGSLFRLARNGSRVGKTLSAPAAVSAASSWGPVATPMALTPAAWAAATSRGVSPITQMASAVKATPERCRARAMATRTSSARSPHPSQSLRRESDATGRPARA